MIGMKKIKIAFVVDKLGVFEISSIPLLSAIAKKSGAEVNLFELSHHPKQTYSRMKVFSPDIVAYSISSNEAHRYLEINRELKNTFHFFSVFGGPHPTFFPSFIQEASVDSICRGEGDIVFSELIKNFATERMYDTGNFSFRISKNDFKENPIIGLTQDLDTLPFPDRALVYSQKYFLAHNPIKIFLSGRGCPYSCTYCFNHAYNAMYAGKGNIMRTKSVDYLIREIEDVARNYPIKFIKFHDDIFGLNREWLDEFAHTYPRSIGLPFLCYARPNIISAEYAKQLRRAGCYSASLAIESGNDMIRNLILNRNISEEQILSACAHLKNAGIRIYSLNMVGLPGESEKEIFSTISLNQQAKIDFADATIFQPYPGTKISEYCKANGYLNEHVEKFESQYTSTILNFPDDFKRKVYVLHKLFPMLVDFPKMQSCVSLLYKLKLIQPLLNLVYKLYYGFNLNRKIYASRLNFKLKVLGALDLLFSESRI